MDQIVAQPTAPATIQANISGPVYGQVAVGNNNILIGDVHGGVVNVNLPGQRPRRRARPTPVYVLPRRFAGLLDREGEVRAAAGALPAAQPAEFHAASGMGKSTLLRVLARHPLATALPDGVIYLSALDQTRSDLLQSIFDALFEYDAPYKPSEGEIRQALQEKRALILLDDVGLSRDEMESLLDAAPQSAFLLASPDRKLWREGLSLPLPGLPPTEARLLLERELGRSLSEEETVEAAELLAALNGNPLAIIQAAALAREQGDSLKSLALSPGESRPEKRIAAALLGLLTAQERSVLASIAALGGAPLNAHHLPALTGISPAEPVLLQLQKQGLILRHGTGFKVAASLAAFIEERWDLSGWRETMLIYFRDWVASRAHEPQRILEDAVAILRLIEWAAESGHSEGALSLAKVVEGALALGLRWGAWEQVLQAGLAAAQALKNQPSEAWALHQIGTRALGLGERAAALQSLRQALRLRERLGDRAGAAVTRHNLNLLLGPPGGNGGSPPQPPSNPIGSLYNLAIGTLTALVASGVALSSFLLAIGFFIPHPPANLPPTPPIQASPSAAWVPARSQTPWPSTGSTATPQTPTGTSLPAPTDSPAPTELPPPTKPPGPLIPCSPRWEWPAYIVRRGDTLWSIAHASASSVAELQVANCLPDTRIYAGQPLLVPRPPLYPPTSTSTPTPTASPTVTSMPTTATPQLPDLVVSLQFGPVAWTDTGGEVNYYAAPLTLSVTNQGSAAAGPFAVVAYYGGPEPANGHLAFQVAEPLGPGATRTISDKMEFVAPSGLQSIDAWAIADDCNAEELAPPCAVSESNEDNNQSPVQVVELPRNNAPSVDLVFPAGSETLYYHGFDGKMWYTDLTLSGSAQDPEEGALDGDSLVWTTDQTALQAAELGRGAAIEVRLYSNRCAGTTHTITLTASDSQLAQGSASGVITLIPLESCSPKIVVKSPLVGAYPYTERDPTGERYLLILEGQVEATDARGRPIVGDAITWTTDQSAVQPALLGHGESIAFNLYMPNTSEKCERLMHTVSVTATDAEGNQAMSSIAVTILECGYIG